MMLRLFTFVFLYKISLAVSFEYAEKSIRNATNLVDTQDECLPGQWKDNSTCISCTACPRYTFVSVNCTSTTDTKCTKCTLTTKEAVTKYGVQIESTWSPSHIEACAKENIGEVDIGALIGLLIFLALVVIGCVVCVVGAIRNRHKKRKWYR